MTKSWMWRLDRLGRSLTALITELELLASLDVGISLAHRADRDGDAPQGVSSSIWSALSRSSSGTRFRERTNAGLEAARRVGTKLGRPPAISDGQWLTTIALMEEPTNMAVSGVAKLLGVTRQAIYKRLRRDQGSNDRYHQPDRNIDVPVVQRDR